LRQRRNQHEGDDEAEERPNCHCGRAAKILVKRIASEASQR
jgi:hypothetical protein